MRINFNFIKWEVGLILSARKKRNDPISGVTNRTADGYYITFLDYDEMPIDWVIGELESIQKEFDLSEIYIFSSSKNHYHIVNFDKLTREEYEAILHRSSCDSQYKKVPWAWGKRLNTLRVSEKKGSNIKLEMVLNKHRQVIERQRSLAHASFFKNYYDFEVEDGYYDQNKQIILATYKI